MARQIEKYNKPILLLCIILIVLIVALVIIFEIRNNNQEEGLIAIESIQNELQEFAATPVTERENNKALEDSITNIINTYRMPYIRARAHFLLGTLYAEQAMWFDAARVYRIIFDEYRRNYLAPLALYNSAISLEMAGDLSMGLETLLEFIDYYQNEEVPYLPRALFNVGRLYETQGDIAMAIKHFQRVVDEYSGSDYVALATNRLILLQPPK